MLLFSQLRLYQASANKLKMNFNFQRNNDTKHTSTSTEDQVQNRIEEKHPWHGLKSAVHSGSKPLHSSRLVEKVVERGESYDRLKKAKCQEVLQQRFRLGVP